MIAQENPVKIGELKKDATDQHVHVFDVVIVGGGFSGLWAAYYLKLADPNLEIGVLEAGCVGFGASGRNGGWCSALFPASWDAVAKQSGDLAATELARHMRQTVDVIGHFVIEHDLQIDWQKGGTFLAARDNLQMKRAAAHVANEIAWGNNQMRLLDAAQAQKMCGATQVLGGSFNPHCAAIDPALLVIGLAQVVESLGVKIFERTRVEKIEAGSSKNEGFAIAWVGEIAVKAPVVLRATEGFTPLLPGAKRDLVPVYSLMIATEPLGPELWAEIGLDKRQTFADYANLIIYGQRTTDGRLAFGGRGAPYHFGSNIRPTFDQDLGVHQMLAETLVRWFPFLADHLIEYRWGGPLGISRDWYSGVRLDSATGLGSVGGYVGDGVGTANLAGRTFADLVTRNESELTRLPWVNRPMPKWEPEPLRWLGINAALGAARASDWLEARTMREAPWAPILSRLTGD